MSFGFLPDAGFRNIVRHCRLFFKLNRTNGHHRSYKAVVCTEFGKPLQLADRERRKLEDNEVRVAVKRAAVNFGDILVVRGAYQEHISLPYFPGTEIAGEVVEIGSKVLRLKPGDRVVALQQSGGGYAEEMIAEDKLCHSIGKETKLDEGAAILVSYGTAQLAFERTAQIKETDSVLVTAAAGALGLAAVDLAANVYKATAIGACGGTEKLEIVSKFGAKFTIDYKKENLRERIKEITKGKGIDIAFDSVGGEMFEDSLKCLAYEGKLLTLGYASGKVPSIPANVLLLKNASVHGVYWGSYFEKMPEVFQHSVTSVLKLWKEGRITPHVGKIFPLSQINDALEFVSSRQSIGKVVLDCTNI